jgi:folate-binding protein YgfZ
VRDVGPDFERISGARAAWLDLSERGRIAARGEDRVRFLDGMLTCEVARLEPGAGADGLLLDRKGHVVATLRVLAIADTLLLDTAPGTGPTVLGALGKLIVADDVSLADLGGAWRTAAVEGPGAPEALDRIGVRAPAPGRGLERDGLVVWSAGEVSPAGIRVLGPTDAVRDLERRLALPPLAPDAAEALRVAAFVPRHGVDVGGRNFPQEARLESSLSYTKGCYVGQEIVARIRSRGQVNRLLVQLRADAPVAAGARIRRDAHDIGEVTSAAVSPGAGPLALGYVRPDSAAIGTALSIDGVRAVVVYPPLGGAGAEPSRA